MPEVSAARSIPRVGRSNETGRVPRLGVLGPARPRMGRPRGAASRRRPRPRGPRRQPEGAGLHPGTEPGLAVTGLAPGGIRETAGRDLPGTSPPDPDLLQPRRNPVLPPFTP